MEDALKDLNALMTKAKEMIRLAQEINERLKTSSTTDTLSANGDREKDDAAQLAQKSLKQIGLVDAAVTAEAHSDESRYHQELAKELATVLQPAKNGGKPSGVMARGLAGLDEVWCVWNRARGLGERGSISSKWLCAPC